MRKPVDFQTFVATILVMMTVFLLGSFGFARFYMDRLEKENVRFKLHAFVAQEATQADGGKITVYIPAYRRESP